MADPTSQGPAASCPLPLSNALASGDHVLHYHATKLGPLLERLLSSASQDDLDEQDEQDEQDALGETSDAQNCSVPPDSDPISAPVSSRDSVAPSIAPPPRLAARPQHDSRP